MRCDRRMPGHERYGKSSSPIGSTKLRTTSRACSKPSPARGWVARTSPRCIFVTPPPMNDAQAGPKYTGGNERLGRLIPELTAIARRYGWEVIDNLPSVSALFQGVCARRRAHDGRRAAHRGAEDSRPAHRRASGKIRIVISPYPSEKERPAFVKAGLSSTIFQGLHPKEGGAETSAGNQPRPAI